MCRKNNFFPKGRFHTYKCCKRGKTKLRICFRFLCKTKSKYLLTKIVSLLLLYPSYWFNAIKYDISSSCICREIWHHGIKRDFVILLEHGTSQRARALAQPLTNSVTVSRPSACSVYPLYENERKPQHADLILPPLHSIHSLNECPLLASG